MIFNIFRKIKKYEKFLFEEEKSEKTIKKYISDIMRFKAWLKENKKGIIIFKSDILRYKEYLLKNISIRSVGGNLSSLTSYFRFIKRFDLIVKREKSAKRLFFNYEKMLTKADVGKLIDIAIIKGNIRLALIIVFIVNTGVRVSELQYITVENLKNGIAYVKGKNKYREVIIPKHISDLILEYCKANNINKYVFITRTGKFIDRRNIWRDIKNLCKDAKVEDKKVFPHNLRHYFAVEFYNKTKDLDKVALILGHSSVETSRIYTAESIDNYRNLIDKIDFPFMDTTKY